MSTKRLAGSVSGGRQEKAMYIPDIYTKTQNQWVDSFYKQNGYLGLFYIHFSLTQITGILGLIHCSAVITRSLGAINTDCVIHDNPTYLNHCSFLQLL